MYDPLGLSIGTTNLVAARDGNPPVSRRAVLTLYPHCAPKVGLPEEDPNLTEPGMLMSGFVDRVGDSVALVSVDGSAHDPDLLMVEALDAMVLAAGADAGSSEISIAVPSYWKPATAQALRNGLRTHLGFVRSGMAPRLVSDAIASLTAANAELCLAATGVVGLLDFGGSGTSATLIDLAGDFKPLSATMRYTDFSGDVIDQALLLCVFEELGHGSGIDPASTAAVGQLARLREQCRSAKEQLSTERATEFAAELGGRRATMKFTRDELGDLIQDRLTGLIYAFDDMLCRHRKSWNDLSAVVTVGGGASIPLVNERLSVHSRRPVVSPSQPAFAAAAGALLLAARGEEVDLRTRTSIGLLTSSAAAGEVVDLGVGDLLVIDEEALTDRELAWSQTEYPGDIRVPYTPEAFDEESNPGGWSMRLNVIEPPRQRAWRRVRLSQLVVGMFALVAMTAIGGVAYTLTGIENHQAPPVPTMVPVPVPPVSSMLPSLAPPPPAPPSAVPPPPSAEPAPVSVPPPPPPPPEPPPAPPPPPPVVTAEPPPVVTHPHPRPPQTTQPPVMTTPTTTPPPPPPPTTTPPPPPPTSTTVPMTTQWIHVPLLPVPIPIQVPASQVPANPAPQYPAQQYPGQYPGGGYGGGYPGGGYPQNPFLGPGY
ncbi:Hsp70 family protein [Mycobacterium sp. Aquia_216]|uniref:Hsp70 family protein n=1 Tax=Mycobacterium sp. Aquia_216 TaxID=2991729 RepID=UPI00227BAE95|nr:Hsp70 family protein [Mycobacterium sp. Aquia_216]WAJ45760.1 Hsp70 family protein [Mycobacterium sp. Aquia_216]